MRSAHVATHLCKGCVPRLQYRQLRRALERGSGLLQLLVHPHNLPGEGITDHTALLQYKAYTTGKNTSITGAVPIPMTGGCKGRRFSTPKQSVTSTCSFFITRVTRDHKGNNLAAQL